MKFKLRNFSFLLFFLFMSFASVLGFSQFNEAGLGRTVIRFFVLLGTLFLIIDYLALKNPSIFFVFYNNVFGFCIAICYANQIDVYGRIVEKKVAEKLQDYKEVTLHGFVPFSEIDLSQYAFLLSTSTRENLPISIVEILKFKLSVLAFSVGGIPEVIDDTSGRLLDTKDMKKNVGIIRQVIEQRGEFTFDNIILDKFDWNLSSEKYLNIFKTLIL